MAVENVRTALRPLRHVALAARRDTSPVALRYTVEERLTSAAPCVAYDNPHLGNPHDQDPHHRAARDRLPDRPGADGLDCQGAARLGGLQRRRAGDYRDLVR